MKLNGVPYQSAVPEELQARAGGSEDLQAGVLGQHAAGPEAV